MWQTVPLREPRFRQQQQRRRPTKAEKDSSPLGKLDEASSSSPSIPSTTQSFKESDVNSIAKQIRQVATALSKEKWVREIFVSSVYKAIEVAALGSCACVRLLALGVGSWFSGFHDEGVHDGVSAASSRSAAILQSGLLLCLREALAHRISVAKGGTTDQSSAAATTVSIEYFDPVLLPADEAVCAKLNFAVRNDNRLGAYPVVEPSSPSSAFLVTFMPHCSGTLYHNAFAANWVSAQGVAMPLERLVVIGNNLTKYPSTSSYCFEKLIDERFVQVTEVFNPSSRSRRDDGGVGKFSFSDIEKAFSDLCVTSWSATQVDGAAVRAVLDKWKAPRIMSTGADLL